MLVPGRHTLPGNRAGRVLGSLLLAVAPGLGGAAMGTAQEGAAPAVDPAAGRGQVRGEVSGPDGAPLVGVSIVLAPAGHLDVLYATSTDEKGKYAFNGLVPDTYEVRADGQGLTTVIKPGMALRPPFRAVIDFQMAAASAAAVAAPVPRNDEGRVGAVEGVFESANGEPVVEGSITFQRRGHAEDLFQARTDATGRFLIRDLPAGRYDISTRSPGLIPLHLMDRPIPAAETIHLRLAAPGYPLSFRGWIEDLLPPEVPLPPPAPRNVEGAPSPDKPVEAQAGSGPAVSPS